jgi:hypothetical protein
VQYFDNFDWISRDFTDPEVQNLFDGDRVARLLCWTKELAQKYPYTTKQHGNPENDRIDMLIDAEIWKFNKQVVYFGIKNRHPDGVAQTAELCVQHFEHVWSLTPDQLAKFDLFTSLFEGTDGHDLSNKARTELDMHWKTELIYGEIRYLYFVPVFDFVKP